MQEHPAQRREKKFDCLDRKKVYAHVDRQVMEPVLLLVFYFNVTQKLGRSIRVQVY